MTSQFWKKTLVIYQFFLFKIRSFKKYLGRFIPNGTYCKETHRKKTDTETEKTIYYYF